MTEGELGELLEHARSGNHIFRSATVIKLIDKLVDCESALVSMVQQYCYYGEYDGETIYEHRFMSAGEEAFNYLVQRGMARWVDAMNGAIVFVKGEGE